MELEIKATLKLEGLEPLANAITALAAAYTGSGAVIEKAKASSKAVKPAPSAEAPASITETLTSAPAPVEVEDSKPVDTQPAAKTVATTESQAPASPEPAAESPSEEPRISDEQIRAAAAAAAKKDRAKVQAIVAKYAANVSGIAQADRAKAIQELEAV